MRAQVRTGNLLTGRLYIALEFTRTPSKASLDITEAVLTVPTVPGALVDVQPQLAEIVARLSRVRFDEIGNDLQSALKAVNAATASLQTTLASADSSLKQLTPEAQADDRRDAPGAGHRQSDPGQRPGDAAQCRRQPDRCAGAAATQRGQALAELQRAAQSLRVLADYLQRHPETLLRGKPEDASATTGDKK